MTVRDGLLTSLLPTLHWRCTGALVFILVLPYTGAPLRGVASALPSGVVASSVYSCPTLALPSGPNWGRAISLSPQDPQKTVNRDFLEKLGRKPPTLSEYEICATGTRLQ